MSLALSKYANTSKKFSLFRQMPQGFLHFSKCHWSALERTFISTNHPHFFSFGGDQWAFGQITKKLGHLDKQRKLEYFRVFPYIQYVTFSPTESTRG